MATFDVSKIKMTWKGQWTVQTKYYKGDIVQWNDHTYRCIKDTPDDFTLQEQTAVSTYNYQKAQSPLVRVSIFPDNDKYWAFFMPSNKRDLNAWEMWRQYQPGDMVMNAGDVYMCTKKTRFNNTWVDESNYWVKILEGHGQSKWNQVVSYANRAPLGWKYNLGSGNYNSESNYASCMCIDGEGNLRREGDYGASGKDGFYPRSGSNKFRLGGFKHAGWLNSTDNASWNSNATGPLTTPDGKAPRIIQVVSNWNSGYCLMNNGELYFAGAGGNGEGGNSTTNTRYYWSRVAASDTVDWYNNAIPRSFNDSRIVKVASSCQGTTNGAASTWAIDEQGGVWCWGYNGTGGLGLGQGTPGNSNNQNSPGLSSFSHFSNINKPVKMPQGLFDNKRIVDIYAFGGGSGGNCHFLDEDGNLWGVGNLNNGALGVGGQGDDYYMNVPKKVLMDFRKHGGIRKIQHTQHDNSEATCMILTNDGWLWWAGYSYYGWWHGYGGSISSTHYASRFRRLLGETWQGKVENFWLMGDRQKGLVFTLYNDDAVYQSGHNYYTTIGGDAINTEYRINSNYGYGVTVKPGPRGCKHVTTSGNGAYSATNSVPYWTTHILDQNNDIWPSGYNGYGQLGHGHMSSMSTSWSYDWNSAYYNETDEYQTYRRVKRAAIPTASKFADVHGSGYSQYGYSSARDQKGKNMVAGTSSTGNSGYETGQYHMYSAEYYRRTGSNPGQYPYAWYHGSPTD